MIIIGKKLIRIRFGMG